jgi:hypothetical protein
MIEEIKKINDKNNLSDDEKTLLINTINKKGFFLEEKAYGILEQKQGLFTLRKNFIPRNYNKQFNERVEVDLIFAQDHKNLIIECKKTDYSWVFPKSLVGSNNINFMVEYEDGMHIRSFDTKEWRVCYSEPMALMMEEDGKPIPDNKGEFVKTQPRQEDPIQRTVLQVLYQTKAWRWEPESIKAISFFVPVILTNAPLFYLDYNAEQIDKNSNLENFNSLKKVKGIIYNYSEFLDWPNAKDEREIKSIFIINIHHFSEFLDWIMLHNLASFHGSMKISGAEKYNFL